MGKTFVISFVVVAILFFSVTYKKKGVALERVTISSVMSLIEDVEHVSPSLNNLLGETREMIALKQDPKRQSECNMFLGVNYCPDSQLRTERFLSLKPLLYDFNWVNRVVVGIKPILKAKYRQDLKNLQKVLSSPTWEKEIEELLSLEKTNHEEHVTKWVALRGSWEISPRIIKFVYRRNQEVHCWSEMIINILVDNEII